jgi:hypothetical protein
MVRPRFFQGARLGSASTARGKFAVIRDRRLTENPTRDVDRVQHNAPPGCDARGVVVTAKKEVEPLLRIERAEKPSPCGRVRPEAEQPLKRAVSPARFNRHGQRFARQRADDVAGDAKFDGMSRSSLDCVAGGEGHSMFPLRSVDELFPSIANCKKKRHKQRLGLLSDALVLN